MRRSHRVLDDVERTLKRRINHALPTRRHRQSEAERLPMGVEHRENIHVIRRPFGGTGPPAAIFYYSRDRRGEHPQAHLAGYAGILQADAYDGYNKLYLAGRSPGPILEAAWAGFALFLEDGRVCLSNNAAERGLRGIDLGRKSWLFCGSDRGGQRAADGMDRVIGGHGFLPITSRHRKLCIQRAYEDRSRSRFAC
jgi:hypothetical protein